MKPRARFGRSVSSGASDSVKLPLLMGGIVTRTEVSYRVPGRATGSAGRRRMVAKLRHPVFAWLGLRPVLAQHTREENDALRRWARERRSLLEVGVGGVVALHDARTFAGGWTTAASGPVELVDQLFRHRPVRGWKIVDEVHSLVIIQRSS